MLRMTPASVEAAAVQAIPLVAATAREAVAARVPQAV
jgi:hypothetical protein